jgi:enamine deaminase RidA (YjgF/YER057c/UK114 family)
MSARLLHAPGLFPHSGYAYAAVSAPGSLVFAAGACPIDADGEVVGGADVAAQARQTMANLVVALDAAGVGLTDVLKTTIYVASADQADLVSAWTVVHDEYFSEHEVPSTLLGVTVLGYSGQLVEIEAIALADEREPIPQGSSRVIRMDG